MVIWNRHLFFIRPRLCHSLVQYIFIQLFVRATVAVIKLEMALNVKTKLSSGVP